MPQEVRVRAHYDVRLVTVAMANKQYPNHPFDKASSGPIMPRFQTVSVMSNLVISEWPIFMTSQNAAK